MNDRFHNSLNDETYLLILFDIHLRQALCAGLNVVDKKYITALHTESCLAMGMQQAPLTLQQSQIPLQQSQVPLQQSQVPPQPPHVFPSRPDSSSSASAIAFSTPFQSTVTAHHITLVVEGVSTAMFRSTSWASVLGCATHASHVPSLCAALCPVQASLPDITHSSVRDGKIYIAAVEYPLRVNAIRLYVAPVTMATSARVAAWAGVTEAEVTSVVSCGVTVRTFVVPLDRATALMQMGALMCDDVLVPVFPAMHFVYMCGSDQLANNAVASAVLEQLKSQPQLSAYDTTAIHLVQSASVPATHVRLLMVGDLDLLSALRNYSGTLDKHVITVADVKQPVPPPSTAPVLAKGGSKQSINLTFGSRTIARVPAPDVEGDVT